MAEKIEEAMKRIALNVGCRGSSNYAAISKVFYWRLINELVKEDFSMEEIIKALEKESWAKSALDEYKAKS
ncbi:MAG: hypothetical protein V4665_03670 [Patescibacteria group bacterium]